MQHQGIPWMAPGLTLQIPSHSWISLGELPIGVYIARGYRSMLAIHVGSPTDSNRELLHPVRRHTPSPSHALRKLRRAWRRAGEARLSRAAVMGTWGRRRTNKHRQWREDVGGGMMGRTDWGMEFWLDELDVFFFGGRELGGPGRFNFDTGLKDWAAKKQPLTQRASTSMICECLFEGSTTLSVGEKTIT